MGHVMVTSEFVSDVVFQAPLENWSGGHVFPGLVSAGLVEFQRTNFRIKMK